MKRRLIWFSWLGVALIVLLSSPAGKYAHAQEGIDHYLFYWFALGHFGGGGDVTLTDQFGTTDLSGTILYHSLFATPVSKEGEPIIDDSAYLNAWGADYDPQPARLIGVRDQFGAGHWVIGDVGFLLAPAKKESDGGTLPAKNHYKCYFVLEGPTVNRIVQLEDQFGVTQVEVLWATYFCNPAEKTHRGQVFPIVNSLGHLVLYAVRDLNPFFVSESIVDQFGAGGQFSNERFYLAVPAFKEYPLAVEESTWGQIKALYRGY